MPSPVDRRPTFSEMLVLLHWILRVSAGGTLSYVMSPMSTSDHNVAQGDVSLWAFRSEPADVWFAQWQIKEAA